MPHTPGPWKTGRDMAGHPAVLPDRHGETLPDGFAYCPVSICRVGEGYGRPEDEAAANARLLAAAPDLLAACRLFLAVLGDNPADPRFHALHDAVRDAVARAEG